MIDRTRDTTAAALSYGALLLLAGLVYGGVIELNPFSPDNVRVLFWADGAPASALARGDAAFAEGWRPFAYLTMWLPYRWMQLQDLQVHYAVNVMLWTACAWLVCLIVYRLTAAAAPALLSGAAVLFDPRAVVTIIVLEHGSAMACLFGLLALFVVITAAPGRVTGTRSISLTLLLLASGLSKEYGLAFTGALIAFSLVERRRDIATAAVAAGLSYTLLRLAIVSPGGSRYCQEMGYFFGSRNVCYDRLEPDVITQAAYNVAATGIGSFLFGLFTTEGRIALAPSWLATSAVWLGCAVRGWWSGLAHVRLALIVVIANALLSVPMYRDRNQVVAVCAIGIVAGVGLAAMQAYRNAFAEPHRFQAAVVAILLVLLGAEANETRAIVAAEVADARSQDPCAALGGEWPLDPAFITKIKTAYAMSNPDCAPHP